MEIWSFVVGIIGMLASVVGIFITVHLAKRTNEIKRELSKRYDIALSTMHFNETKRENISKLCECRTIILDNMFEEMDIKTWSQLDSTLKRIQNDLFCLDDEIAKETTQTINDALDFLSNDEQTTENKNKIIVGYLNDIVGYLESYKHIGG